MPLDGLTLKTLVDELDPLLRNSRLDKIYQPDDYTVTLQLRLPGESYALLISAEPLYPRLHTIQELPVNPAQPPAFCMLLRKHLDPARLLTVKQLGWDRIVHLRFETLGFAGKLREITLVFELLGRHSNLLLVDENGLILDALKRFPARGIAPGYTYQTPPQQGKLEPAAVSAAEFIDHIRLLPLSARLWQAIQNSFQGFSKLAAQEVVRRAGFRPDTTRQELDGGDWQALHSAFAQLLQELQAGGSPAFYPQEEEFAGYLLTGFARQPFPTTDFLIGTVLGGKSRREQFSAAQSALRRRAHTHYKRILKKEALQITALEQAEQAEQWRRRGELLTASFHQIQSGQKEIEVPDYTKEGQPLVAIELDPRLSPSANVQQIFKRYRKAKSAQKHTRRQLRRTRREKAYFEDILVQIDLADNPQILEEIEAELGQQGYLKKQKARSRRALAHRRQPERYRSADGLPILVGRSNRENDQLTFKISGPHHLWLHARGVPGSHVVVLAEGEIPEQTLRQAAQLAAYFSKSRSSDKVAVDYTLRSNVRKPKGAKPGFVLYSQAQTIVVNLRQFDLPEKL